MLPPPAPPPAPAIVIERDFGGQIGDYLNRVNAYLGVGTTVRIVGECDSACTMLAALPKDRICVGPRASLGFHQAYLPNRFDPFDTSIRTEDGTRLLMSAYPARLKAWIARKGGLTKDLIVLRGTALRRIFAACRP